MTWTTPSDLRAQVQNLWDRGELLAGLVTGDSLFPKRLVLKGPKSGEMADRFEEVRSWISELRTVLNCRVEMREIRHRVLGTNAVPHQIWVDTAEHAAAIIGKQRDMARFIKLIEMTRKHEPQLLGWLARRSIRALEISRDWELLLAIVSWIKIHPRPRVYLRQVDIPGVHSKFIEAHRAVLAELLDIVLPPAAFDPALSGASQFANRYGFLDKPARIRFRILDPEHALLPSTSVQDITLDADSFARIEPKILRVFITENEINFLAFPQLKNSMVVFGAGYGFEMLNKAKWLSRCHIYYWGDIDTHGFAILDELRGQFDHVESFLMDRNTLHTFEPLWGEEEKQRRDDLSRLNPEEGALYDDLRDNRIRKNLRLEQERIGFGWVEVAISALMRT